MALGEHLGADENARLTAPDLRQPRLEAALGAGRVAVDADEGGAGEAFLKSGFGAFGAGAHRHQLRAAAGWAGFDDWALGSAVVAGEAPAATVQGQPGVALAAGGLPAAVGTKVNRRVAAPVQEHQHLAAGIEVAFDVRRQRVAQALAQGMAADVENAHAGHGRAGGAVAEKPVPIASAADVFERFQ